MPRISQDKPKKKIGKKSEDTKEHHDIQKFFAKSDTSTLTSSNNSWNTEDSNKTNKFGHTENQLDLEIPPKIKKEKKHTTSLDSVDIEVKSESNVKEIQKTPPSSPKPVDSFKSPRSDVFWLTSPPAANLKKVVKQDQKSDVNIETEVSDLIKFLQSGVPKSKLKSQIKAHGSHFSEDLTSSKALKESDDLNLFEDELSQSPTRDRKNRRHTTAFRRSINYDMKRTSASVGRDGVKPKQEFMDFLTKLKSAFEQSKKSPGSDKSNGESSTKSPDFKYQARLASLQNSPTLLKSNSFPQVIKSDEHTSSISLSKTHSFNSFETPELSSPSIDAAVKKEPSSAIKLESPSPVVVDEFDDLDFDEGELEQVLCKYDSYNSTENSQSSSFIDSEDPAKISSTPASQNPTQIPGRVFNSKYERFLVLEVNYSSYLGGGSYKVDQQEKILRLFNENTGMERYLHLREDWWHTLVNVGDYVHIVGEFDEENRCYVDNENNLLILHPDCLISSTHLADSFVCLRKSVLQDRIRETGDTNSALIYGLLLHVLLQRVMSDNDFSTPKLLSEIQTLIIYAIEELYSVGETEETAMEHLKEMIPLIQEWASKYISSRPKPEGLVAQHRSVTGEKLNVSICKILDIEEHIWSPMYGLKGKIDVSVQMKKVDSNQNTSTLVAPFELKTGKSTKVLAHRAQTVLYTLLMSDRYDIDIASGLLYYMKAGEMISVPAVRDEIRGLLIGRNQMAPYLINRRKLPSMLESLHTCQRCYVLDSCLVYHKTVENGDATSSGLGALFDSKVGHITDRHTQFFDKWDKLISLEENDMHRFRKEIWCLLGVERERLGRCFSNMVLDRSSYKDEGQIGGATRYKYRFLRDATEEEIEGNPQKSLLNSQINVGDPVVISSEFGHYALAVGFVIELNPKSLTVSLDRQLRGIPARLQNFDKTKNQDFQGITEIGSKTQYSAKSKTFETVTSTKRPLNEASGILSEEQITYRIDKDELTAGMGLVRNNLVKLISLEGEDKRRLIVDLEPPVFVPVDTHIRETFGHELNLDQRKALEKAISARDYALILGMPGTGKTTTISYIVKALISMKKSVLLVSYTHTAVDNILLKLKHENVDMLRLGNRDKIHSEILEFTPDLSKLTSVKELENFYASKNVVATTCLGIGHNLFTKRRFDYCIVDEASQITLPVCIGPLRFANTFILVGDHYQLPPLVRNSEAKQDGLTISLFKLLSETHPESVVSLEHQYRMNKEIMTLSNALIYNYKLRCGTPNVATWTLEVPNEENLSELHNGKNDWNGESSCSKHCWLRKLIIPESKVLFVDTDEVPGPDSRPGELIQNDIEAQLIHHFVEALTVCGVPESAIGVISPYRSQLKIITHLLQLHSNIEIHTIDKYQGRDKDCILISLVRSNPAQNVGELLRDWRRINVAFTRARKKLIIFGSLSTLRGTHLFGEFLNLMETNNWIYHLPKDAHKHHSVNTPPIEELSQFNTPSKRRRLASVANAVLKKSNVLKDLIQEM
ncbi:DNA replication endonuclease-helicase Dna2 [Basidiobolus ranarum]|uniref:DNA replication ATP-dependent helicase/nuclease n=1 Tax=Basidiobolus ranarum TaxID=34480 RepID=A0ABR2X3U3_9FUNG